MFLSVRWLPLIKDLLVLEEQEGSVNFKFGVLYAKDGQLTDDEMFSNETGSESFDKFLNLLGDSIPLRGWAGYRGGLDTKNDTTGINSIYTVYQGHELMFHVSTMLPYSKENKQQASSHSFPVINGEKATLETPTFAQKRQRTLDMLIRSLYQDLMPDLHKALKLKTIVRGDAPTSLATTGLCRKEFKKVEIASRLGLIALSFVFVEGQAPPVQVFDKTMAVKQMHVLEAQDLLITRTDKGKDARLFVFRLSSIKKGLEDKQLVRSKYDSRENKLEKTKGCHLYCINTHHSSELRIVVAIRNKLLLITRKQNRPDSLTNITMVTTPTESPVEEFQYIREICLCDAPVVMALVDGPTGENDNNICVAYRHQFDLINESTGESYRLHHVEASRSDIYFTSSAAVNSASNSSSKEPSSHSSPQTPTGYEMPTFPSPLGDDSIRIPYGTKLSLYMSKEAEGETQSKHIYKIPLSNLVGRSIERPLKSPLVNKVIATPTSSAVASTVIPVTHSLSLSRMEIKEIASRTRKELLGNLETLAIRSHSDHLTMHAFIYLELPKIIPGSFDTDSDGQRHYSTSSEPDTAGIPEESPTLTSPFVLATSFEEDIVDLK
ncbi:UNVERIFIED_CONTAM: hypothetical protein FKN15_020380 [Acipenser sinensis]